MEAVVFQGSPIAQYLQETGMDDAVVPAAPSSVTAFSRTSSELDFDGRADNEDSTTEDPRTPVVRTGKQAHGGSTLRTKRRRTDVQQEPPVPALPSPASSSDRFADLVKYTMATSFLLMPRLGEAIPLYPSRPIERKHRRTHEDGSISIGEARSASLDALEGRAPQRQQQRRRTNVVEWEDGWESKGHDWRDRNPAENVMALFKVLGMSLFVLIVKAFELASTKAPSEPKVPEPELPPQQKEVGTTVFLTALEGFITRSQQFDLETSKALTAVKEVECVGRGLGLSDPLPPVSRIEAASWGSPAPRSAGRPSPPLGTPSGPPRAAKLRQLLKLEMESILKELGNARLLIKQATGDRESEMEDRVRREWERELLEGETSLRVREIRKSERSRDKRSSWDGVSALDGSDVQYARRKRPLDDGPHSAAALEEIKRPDSPSLLMLRGGKHRSDFSRDAISIPPTPNSLRETTTSMSRTASRCSTPDMMASPETDSPLSLMALQSTFEQLHSVRRGLLWRVLELVERDTQQDQWRDVASVLGELGTRLEEETETVSKAVAAEFPLSAPISDSLHRASSLSKAARRMSMQPTSSPLMQATTVEPRSRPVSWASNASRPLTLVSSGATASTAPSSTTSISPPKRRPLSIGHFPPAALNLHQHHSSLSSLSGHPFAPPHPNPSMGPQSAANAFDVNVNNMALALRSVTAKLHVVQEDMRKLAANPVGDEEDGQRLLGVHNSVKDDLRRLLGEWEDSRISLRKALRRDDPYPAEDVTSETDGEFGGTSLDSIPDADEPDDDDMSSFSGRRRDSDALFSQIGSPVFDQDEVSPAVLDASTGSHLPPPGLEQVFEAVAAGYTSRGAGARGPDGKPLLSREERINLARENRDGRVKKRSSISSMTDRKSSDGTRRGSIVVEAGMVAELQDVLKLLKGRRQLPADA